MVMSVQAVQSAIPADVVADAMATLATPAGQADPYPIYAMLHRAGAAGVGPDATMVVVGYAACAALLREHRMAKTPERALTAAGFPDWRQHSSLQTLYGSMLMANPPGHTRLRQKVTAAFTPRRVAALRPTIEAIATELVEQLDGTSDFVDRFAFPLPVTVIGELLGIPAGDRRMFQALVRDWTTVLEILNPLAVSAADAAADTIRGYLLDLARTRRSRPRDDLISALVADQGDDALCDDEVVTMLALLLGAGFETTTGLLANGLCALLRNPAAADRLRRCPELAGAAATELLRLDTPVQMLFGRTSTAALDTAGVGMEAGQRLVTIVGAANRDPRVFDRPDGLDLVRTGPAPLSFGGGIHYCLGAPLAHLEAEIAFPAVLTRYPALRLVAEPTRRPGLTLRGYVRMPVAT